MNKTCARCEKTVYPTEELKCLDKAWHKGCFKCQECGMTLNMKTYKGYDKLPYCEAHVPKAKHTTMADTPELKRIAENTKHQSNVKYHADFEKSKGKFTQVVDDPETLRNRANTRIFSKFNYQGDLEKKAQMEKQRQINENGELVDVPTDYHQQINNYATEMLPPPHLPPKSHYQTPVTHPIQAYAPVSHLSQQNLLNHQAQNPHNSHPPNPHTPNSHPSNSHPSNSHPSNSHPQNPHPNRQYQEYSMSKEDYYQYQNPNHAWFGHENQDMEQKIGKIHDYDPMEDGPRAPLNTKRATSTVVYNSNLTSDKRGAHQPSQSQARQIGRVTDYDPLAKEMPRASTNNHQPPPAPAPVANQKVYIAMYDYEANDNDEVSFREGDLISNVSSIDEGWMTGQVLRTGRAGMLPANYVAECPPQHAQPY